MTIEQPTKYMDANKSTLREATFGSIRGGWGVVAFMPMTTYSYFARLKTAGS